MNKTKIIVIAVLILVVCFVINWFLDSKQNSVPVKTYISKEKSIKCNISAVKGTINTKPILKEINRKEIIRIDTIRQIDTLIEYKYMAETDTTISVIDTIGKLRGIVSLNTKFISDIPISKKAFFETDYKINSISYDTFEKETIKEVIKEKNNSILNNLGVGIFAGGIINHNKNIDYGFGFGIVYKLTK